MKQLSFSDLKELCCRSFNPKETMAQIIVGNEEKFLKWNVDKQIEVLRDEHNDVIGMVLKLDHKNYSDRIFISLSFLDYYNVHFIDGDLNLLFSIEEVDCFTIFSAINKALENVTKFQISLN